MILPEKFVERMKLILKNEYDNFYDSLCTSPIYTGIRINTLKENAREAILAEFGELSEISWCEHGFYADKSKISGKHPYHTAGLFYFQEPSAMSVVEALPINKGDYVLDLCAAPGGKSTQAAAKLNGSGLIVSNEIVKKRADILSENMERMGVKNAIVTNETPQKLAQKYPHFFDKIIVDAPCSGEGMFRKEPQAVTVWSEEHTLSCAVRQKNIIDSAMEMLKPGGYLIYSTCTFSPDENERVADYILTEYNMELCDMPSLSILDEGNSEYGNTTHEMSKTRRIFPHHHDGEGHFIALFHNIDSEMEKITKKFTSKINYDDEKLYREFEKTYLNVHLSGSFITFGTNLYILPSNIDIDKIKVVRAGLHLGVLKKNRFEPSHALALALKPSEIKNTVECDFETVKSYLKGNVIPCDKQGWCVVTYNSYPLGWGKASNGILKNHYPKYLRLV